MASLPDTITFDKGKRGTSSPLFLTENTGEILRDLSATGRERPWRARKLETTSLGELYEMAKCVDSLIISDTRLQQLRDCGSTLLFGEDSEGARRLQAANFCRVRLCPMCNWRRSLKLFTQVSRITDAMLLANKVRFIFATFTCRNVDGQDLSKTIDNLGKAFTCFTSSRRRFAPMRDFTESSLLGYMKAIEVTYNAREQTFHPHIHVIFAVKPVYFDGHYLTHDQWRAAWQKALGVDYAPMVNVKKITATAKAVAEVGKYPVKMSDVLKVQDKTQASLALIQLHRAIFKRRLVTFGGLFKQYKQLLALDDVENGDLTHVEADSRELNEVAQVLFKWRADVGAYIC